MTQQFPDPARLVYVMRNLNDQVAKFQKENEELTLSKDKLQLELSLLEKKYNDLTSSGAAIAPSKKEPPVAENPTIDRLAALNLKYQKELEATHNENTVQELREKLDFEKVIHDYKTTLKEKEEEIALLRQNSHQSNLIKQYSHLKQVLQKTIEVNASYAHAINNLHSQLSSFRNLENSEATVETTEAQAVSGDQDLHNSSNDLLEYNEKLEKDLRLLKQENAKLEQQLRQANESIKEQRMQLDEVTAREVVQKDTITELQQFMRSSKNDFPMESQLKAFWDDYNTERQEKEQQFKKNMEIREENIRLRQEKDVLERQLSIHQQSLVPQEVYHKPSNATYTPHESHPYEQQTFVGQPEYYSRMPIKASMSVPDHLQQKVVSQQYASTDRPNVVPTSYQMQQPHLARHPEPKRMIGFGQTQTPRVPLMSSHYNSQASTNQLSQAPSQHCSYSTQQSVPPVRYPPIQQQQQLRSPPYYPDRHLQCDGPPLTEQPEFHSAEDDKAPESPLQKEHK